jgi:hypothetical protein
LNLWAHMNMGLEMLLFQETVLFLFPNFPVWCHTFVASPSCLELCWALEATQNSQINCSNTLNFQQH